MSRRFTQFELGVGIALLTMIVALVFVASVMRFLDRPLIWSVDLAQLLFIWLCFLGASRAMRERAHLGVDLIIRQLNHRGRLWLETGLALLFAAFMAVLAWEGARLTLLNSERMFGDSGISYAYVTIAVPVGCLFLTGSMLANLVEAWRNRNARQMLVFTRSEDGANGKARR